MQDKNWDMIAGLEREIATHYGELATVNPLSLWDEEKEKKYLEELKEFEIKNRQVDKRKEKIDFDGVLVPKKLISSDTNKVCSICKCYSFSKNDDLYLYKFKACYKCYCLNIEGRNGDQKNE